MADTAGIQQQIAAAANRDAITEQSDGAVVAASLSHAKRVSVASAVQGVLEKQKKKNKNKQTKKKNLKIANIAFGLF